MALLALPMMAQFASRAELMAAKTDRSIMRDTETLFCGFENDDELQGWYAYDADGDGNNWGYEDYYAHSGNLSFTSRSFYGSSLDPDNWFISPKVPLGGTLTFWAMNYNSIYADNLAIFVCVGDLETLNEFVQVSEIITPPTTWTEYTIDLSDYAGETGYFAFRHFNSYDMFRLLLDDVSYTYETAPVTPVTPVPVEVEVIPGVDKADVSWVNDENVAWNLRYRPYTPEPELPGYFWDFEDETELSWTSEDADGDGFGWFIWDPISLYYDPGDGVRLFGTKCATSASYNDYGALTPDDWMISPLVTLHKNFSFWAAGQDPDYADEVFAVYVKTEDSGEFVKISDDITATYPIQQYTFDLSEYEGMKGYVAFRHYNCYDMFRLNIDNVLIGEMPDRAEEAEWIYVYNIDEPNYTIDGLDPETTYEVQVQGISEDGVPSEWTESVLFTTLPEEVPQQTAAPEVVTTPGDDAYTITGQVKAGDPEAEVTIFVWDEEEEDWVAVGNPFVVNRTEEEQTVKIKVVSHIEGQTDGELIMDVVVPALPEDPGTGVNELMNGKSIATVRYFNMAGQEMQEANGMTIVVTTYSDGTTTAVKVMK